MSLHKCKLGELITQRREKNNDDSLPISGVSKDGLIPPKQQEADTSLYNMFYRGDFIFNPARMELNSIAYNDKYDKAICSSLYEVFYVHRTDLILPEFLALIVKQDWFIRYCEFLGQGSAREYCRFANISEIEIEFPDIDVQKKTVHCYNVIKRRIELKQQINDNLEALATALFKSWFVDYEPFEVDETDKPIGWIEKSLSQVLTTTTNSVNPQKLQNEGVWHYSIPAFDSERLPVFDAPLSILSNKYVVPRNSILVSKLNPETKRIWITSDKFENAICSTEFIIFIPNNPEHRDFYYLLFNTPEFIDFLVSNATGSTNSRMRVKPASTLDFKLFMPQNVEVLDDFCKMVHPILNTHEKNLFEIRNLRNLTPIAVAKMMSSSR